MPGRLRHVLVVGGGRTGCSAARWLRAQGVAVSIHDDQPDALKTWHESTRDLRIWPTSPPDQDWDSLDGCLVGPGIPHAWPQPHRLVRQAQQAGVPLLSEMDLWAASRPDTRVVGITGTNGKSTTTALVHHILRHAGVDAAMGGNMGTPVFDMPDCAVAVLELSSFQLERTRTFCVDVGILLNITPDHLDRHGGMHGYVAAKQNIFRQGRASQTWIVGENTPESASLALWARAGGRAVTSTSRVPLPSEIPASLQGVHNRENMQAALAAVEALGVSYDTAVAACPTFAGLAHRQEVVGHSGGGAGATVWVNDSKATNIVSLCTALACMERVYLIAGGRPKNEPLDPLLPFRDRIVHTFLVGEAASAWAGFWAANAWPVTFSMTLEQAVADVLVHVRKDPEPHRVLLSPACASYDQFPHFRARGDAFRACVRALVPDLAPAPTPQSGDM